MIDSAGLFTLDETLFAVPIPRALAARGVRVFLAHITPDIATALLTRHPRRRGRRVPPRRTIKRAIEHGRWTIPCDMLIFDQAGGLLDGLKPLHAVVDTAQSVWMLLVSGWSNRKEEGIPHGHSRRITGSLPAGQSPPTP